MERSLRKGSLLGDTNVSIYSSSGKRDTPSGDIAAAFLNRAMELYVSVGRWRIKKGHVVKVGKNTRITVQYID